MDFITYEQEGFVGIVTINRPQALNALNSQVLDKMPSHAVNDFVPRPPVAFENACVYRGFSTGGLVWRPPLDLL